MRNLQQLMSFIAVGASASIYLGCGAVYTSSEDAGRNPASIADSYLSPISVTSNYVDLIPIVDVSNRTVTYNNLPSGRMYSFNVFELGKKTSLTCSGANDWATVKSGALHIDLGIQPLAGQKIISCSGLAGGITFVFNHAKSTVALISSSSSVSMDGFMGFGSSPVVSARNAAGDRWVFFQDTAAGFKNTYQQIIGQNPFSKQMIGVSTLGDGTLGDNHSTNASVSSDGRYVVFESIATNFVAGMPFGTSGGSGGSSPQSTYKQIYMKDLGALSSDPKLVSSKDGTVAGVGNGDSSQPAISSDGNYVVFTSAATNFVSGTLSSIGSGASGASGSSSAYQIYRKYLRDLTQAPILVSALYSNSTTVTAAGDAASSKPAISADGSYVSFVTTASNLVSGKYVGSTGVLLARNMNVLASSPVLISTADESASLQQSPLGNLIPVSNNGGISDDGLSYSFTSHSFIWNYVTGPGAFVKRRVSASNQTLVGVSSNSSGNMISPPSPTTSLSPDASLAVFPSLSPLISGVSGEQLYLKRTNSQSDVPRLLSAVDSTTPSTSAVGSVNFIDAKFSSDSQYVAFSGGISNFASGDSLMGSSGQSSDVYMKNLLDLTQAPLVAAPAQNTTHHFLNGVSRGIMSPSNNKLIFESDLTKIISSTSKPPAQQIYIKDLSTPMQEPKLVSNSVSNSFANGDSSLQAISQTGRFVVFSSTATNIVNASGPLASAFYLKDLNAPLSPPVIINSSDSTAYNQTNKLYPGSVNSVSADGVVATFSSSGYAAGSWINATATIPYKKDMRNPQNPPVPLNVGQAPPVGYVYSCSSNLMTPDAHYVVLGCYGTSTDGYSGYFLVRKDMNNLNGSSVVVNSANSNSSTQSSALGATSVGLTLPGSYDISDDGRFVVFSSTNANFIGGSGIGPSQVYIKDMNVPASPPVIVSSANSNAVNQTGLTNYIGGIVKISGDGRYIFYSGYAGNVVPGYPSNDYYYHILVKDRLHMDLPPRIINKINSASVGLTEFISYVYPGSIGYFPSISTDGSQVMFSGTPRGLVPGISGNLSTSTASQIFLKRWLDDQ